MVSIWGQHLFSSFFGIKFLYSIRQIKSRCLSASPIWSCNADYPVFLNKDLAHNHCTILAEALKHLRNQCYAVVVFLLLSSDLPHRCNGTMLFPLWLNISLSRKKLNAWCDFHYLIERGVNRNEGTSFFQGAWTDQAPSAWGFLRDSTLIDWDLHVWNEDEDSDELKYYHKGAIKVPRY